MRQWSRAKASADGSRPRSDRRFTCRNTQRFGRAREPSSEPVAELADACRQALRPRARQEPSPCLVERVPYFRPPLKFRKGIYPNNHEEIQNLTRQGTIREPFGG